MFTTLLQDRKKIEEKYHSEAYYKAEHRLYNYRTDFGYPFDAKTGMDREAIDAGLRALSQSIRDESHPVQKAKMFAFVLENTRIDIAPHDYFVGIEAHDRPVERYARDPWADEFTAKHAEESELFWLYEDSGTMTGWLDYDHLVPDWDALLSLGFTGILQRLHTCYEAIEAPTKEQTERYEGMVITYEAILAFLDRAYQYASQKDFEKAPAIAACLKHLREGAPTDTYEAMQLMYLFFVMSDCVEYTQVRSLGYGLDNSLYPFYAHDLETGRYTEAQLREFMGYFLMQWAAMDNYWGQPAYLGGRTPDGKTKVNALSYVILDVYEALHLYNPKLQVKLDSTTPHEFLVRVLSMIRAGASSVVLCNNEAITKALMSRGHSFEKSVDSVIRGCYEYTAKHEGSAIEELYSNMAKPLTLILNDGVDAITGKRILPACAPLSAYIDFHSLYLAYLDALAYTIEKYFHALRQEEYGISIFNPTLLHMATFQHSVSDMSDVLTDPRLHNMTNLALSGLATAVDSLMAIKTLVYEEKVVTLPQLKQALDADWVGYEELRTKALRCVHKYGNGDEMADHYAGAIVRFTHDLLAGKRNSVGGKYNLELHSARTFLIFGERTEATPDGRKRGEEVSKNASPVVGMDKKGITALINSATTIDCNLCNDGFPLDVMLHPSAIQGENGLRAMEGVVQTYFARGGALMQLNIFDSETLRDAQKHPERYETLQVRVSGWNVLWNRLSKVEQDAYIRRAEEIAR